MIQRSLTQAAARRWENSSDYIKVLLASQHFSAGCKILAKIFTFQLNNCHLGNDLLKVVHGFWQVIVGSDSARKIPSRVVEPSKTPLSSNGAEVLCDTRCSLVTLRVSGFHFTLMGYAGTFSSLLLELRYCSAQFSPFQLIGMCLFSPE